MHKIWPFALLLAGAFLTYRFHDGDLDTWYMTGILLMIMSLVWVTVSHFVRPAPKGPGYTFHWPVSKLFYISLVLITVAAGTYILERRSTLICSSEDFGCLGLFLMFTVPVAIVGLLFLIASFLITPSSAGNRKK